MPTTDEHIYNIGAVERMTGIPSATLRAWERRYGFPESGRTAGGHRLYSQEQIEGILWVKRRTEEGMQTGQAVIALRQLLSEGGIAAESPSGLPDGSRAPATGFPQLSDLEARFTAALLANDLAEADLLFRRELVAFPVEEVAKAVILPALQAVGDAWEAGDATVATEHLASQYIRSRLMLWLRTGPPPYDVAPTILACAPGELHEGTLLILATLLTRRRWPILYLGQAVPLDDLASFVAENSPLAVVLVAMREETAAALESWPEAMPEPHRTGRPPVGYAGRAFVLEPAWKDRVPGAYLGDTVLEGLATLEGLLVDAAGDPLQQARRRGARR
jgi:DNA-binding transcriptional MerR regulator